MTNGNSIAAVREWLDSGAWMVFAGHLFKALVIFAIAWALAWALQKGLTRLRRHAKLASPLIYIVEKVGSYAILLVGLFAGLATLGLNLSSFAVFAGATGVGVGLGLQGVVKEFVSGLVLIFDPMVKVGDFIELEDGLRGEIVEIGPRATRVRTNDALNAVIPNSSLMQVRMVNWTYNEESRRIHVPFSVADESDKGQVRDVVLAAARALLFTSPDQEHRKTQVWLVGFGGDGLDFELIVWPSLESSRHPASMHAAYTWAIHEALLAAGIKSADPQLDLHVRSLFDRRGDHALRSLKLDDQLPAQPSAPPEAGRPPNDAAAAVFDDAVRDSRARQAETRRRERQI